MDEPGLSPSDLILNKVPGEWIAPVNQGYRCSVLLVDDQPGILAILKSQLSDEYDTTIASSVAEAREHLARHSFEIVLSDLQLAGHSGLEFLDWVRRHHPDTARILVTGTAMLEDAAQAINRCQIHRLILKPWKEQELLASLKAVSNQVILERSHAQLLTEYQVLTRDLERRVQERTAELEARTRELQHKNQILERMALTDALTGLPNRRAIDLIARKELLRRTRTPAPIAIGMIDADHFKDVNSTHTHSGGDHILTWLGKVLHANVRASDSLGRIGGEEFMVVAPQTDLEGAHVLAERLRGTVEESKTIFRDCHIQLTVSVGFAVLPEHVSAGYDQLREVAATSLAKAKDSGRNRSVVTLYTP